jgi:hypothetical protein
MAISYHRMSLAQKQATARDRMREALLSCPICEVQMPPAELVAHREQPCDRREPHPAAKWVTWREALSMAPKRSMLRWIKRGAVRFRGERGERLYLLRDIATRLSRQSGFRRR